MGDNGRGAVIGRRVVGHLGCACVGDDQLVTRGSGPRPGLDQRVGNPLPGEPFTVASGTPAGLPRCSPASASAGWGGVAEPLGFGSTDAPNYRNRTVQV